MGTTRRTSARLLAMAEASRRTKIWVWVVVLTLFAGAAWFAVDTLRSSVQPFGVISDPFPAEEQRPAAPEGQRSPVNFLVFGQAADEHQTLSIFHLANGRRRVDIVNFSADAAALTDIQNIPGTVAEVEALTKARMEHVLLWDLEFLVQLETLPINPEQVFQDPGSLHAQDVWSAALQEALSVQDPGELKTLASSMTPYVDADAALDTGRIGDLARSLRYVSPQSVTSCEVPVELSAREKAQLVSYFKTGTPRHCADIFG